MPSFSKAFSSSSSASTSPSNSPLKKRSGSSTFSIFGYTPGGRRLTRQRKLRHATDDDLGLSPRVFNERSQSWPVSPESGRAWIPGSRSRSPRQVGHWSESAVPQPLPTPENSGRRDGDHSSSASTRNTSRNVMSKATNHANSRSPKSPVYRCRGSPEELGVDGVRQNLRIDVSARSAPGSGFTSPVVSPQRFSSVDLFHPSFQSAYAFEASPFYKAADSTSPLSPRRFASSAGHSPLNSPTLQNPHREAAYSTGFAVLAHHKSLPENSAAWREGNSANVHPLPLPPGTSRSSQTPTLHPNLDTSDTSSLKGQWRKGRLIGSGTYGRVYVATHSETGATCAMKEVDLTPDDPKSAECIQQLEQEIKILRHLEHPNIVQYYGSEVMEDRFCIYLEYVHPGSISKYVSERCGAMTESIVRNFTRHVVSGLAFLHSRKTIHRDIKGANLLVNASGVVKLADFGLAKHLTGQATHLSLKGSPHWMAPEVLQAVLRKDANPGVACAIDIWSLGCTVIEMYTGKPPWSELSGVQAMFSVLNKSPPIPETLSPEGKDFLQRCLLRKPADRPSAHDLLKHPFLSSSQDQPFTGFAQEFSGLKLFERAQSPNDGSKLTKGADATYWQNIRNGKLPYGGETSTQSPPVSSETGAASPHSPLYKLEGIQHISSPDMNFYSHYVGHSRVPNALQPGAHKQKSLSYLDEPRKRNAHSLFL